MDAGRKGEELIQSHDLSPQQSAAPTARGGVYKCVEACESVSRFVNDSRTSCQ